MEQASVDTGKAQIDQGLLDALTKVGVADADARELARMDAFGGVPAIPWVAGLLTVVRLTIDPNMNPDLGLLLTPWSEIGTALRGDGQDWSITILALTTHYEPAVQNALLSAVGSVRSPLIQKMENEIPLDIRHGLTTKQANEIEDEDQLPGKVLRVYDPRLVRTVQKILTKKGANKDQLRRAAGEQVIQWMKDHGRFVQTMDKTGYYLFRDERQLYEIKTKRFLHFLYRVTCINPASDNFGFVLADVQATCDEGEVVELVKIAHFDQATKIARVSLFNGTVLRLDGYSIVEECNGDGPVIFEDSLDWVPIKPDYSAGGEVLDWWASLPNFADSKEREAYELLMKAWVVCTFFTELCPTRPLLILYGPPGSGKSMAFRVLVKFLYGPGAQLQGMPDKEDGFTVGVTTYPVFILDNMDRFDKELQDKLALVATGGEYVYRKLYTNNEMGRNHFRAWLGITSRTPDTLKRADLVDRCCIVPVDRIESEDRGTESSFLLRATTDRNKFWGDVIMAIQNVVRAIRESGIPTKSAVRMADFEALARIYARSRQEEQVWERVITSWVGTQADLLLQDSPILQALEIWLQDQSHRGAWVDGRTLYGQLQLTLYGPTDKPDHSWPQSALQFGRILMEQADSLRKWMTIETKKAHGRNFYRFDYLPGQTKLF